MTILSPSKIAWPAKVLEPPTASPFSSVFVDRLSGVARRFGAIGIIRLGSVFLICMGVGALCAWLFHWRAFLQFVPGAPFIVCDTAMGLILTGLALFAASIPALHLSRLLGASLLVFGAVYLTATLRGVYFSVHAFFPQVTAAVVFPAQAASVGMAGATAVAFALEGFSLLLLSSLRPRRIALHLAMLLASAVLSLGLLGMLTSLTGIANLHTWISFLAMMSAPSAISVCVAGVSTGALCWMRTDGPGRRFQTAAPSFTLVGLMLLFIGASFLVVTTSDVELEERRDLLSTSRQISLLQAILNSLRRSETAQLGFLLTGREAYLQDYNAGLQAVTADLQTFRSYPYGDHQADALRTLTTQKLAELAGGMKSGREDKREKIPATVKSDLGLLLMAQIDSESAKLIRALEAHRAGRRKARDETLRITQKTVVFSYGIAFVMIGLGIGVFRAEIGRRAGVESELRKRTSEISDRTAQLEAANRELDEFAFAASHDLKAPLRAIHNSAKWLEEDLAEHLTGETREHLTLLQGRTARMEKLLDDLLAYARIGRNTDSRYNESVSGDLLMEDVLALVALQGFTVQVSPAFRNIKVSRMPLQQILMNLIGNAIKHHHRKSGYIEVTVTDDGDSYAFAVKDDGPGIGGQLHARIFEMFSTLRPRDQVEGSGIGLAMVRKHIEVSGGTLQLESEEGQGSTFRFTLSKDRNKEEHSHEFVRHT